MSDCDAILDMDLTVNHTADEAMDMVKDDGLVLLILSVEFSELLICGELDVAQLGLYNETALVLRQSYVNLDWILDAIRTIDVF